MFRITSVFYVIGILLFLSGCDDNSLVVREQIRAVKTFVVSESAGGNVRKYSGQISASNSATLSFPSSGTVKEVRVSAGDKVAENQILALLDNVPFQLDVEAAEAELRKAQSSANEKKEDYKRNKQLFDKGWVSKAALEQALFAMNTAVEDVSYKTARLNQAKRSLNDATLRAPYAGIVGERFVEPNEEVSGGKQLLTLNAEGALEISISVPENLISKLNMGMPAIVTLRVLSGSDVKGRVTEISRVAGVGNLFPVKVSLIQPPTELRAGMSGEVALIIQSDDSEFGFLIPLSAVTAGEDLKGGFVFIVDETSSTVKKTRITADAARDQFIAVKGIHPGDRVVTAGVSFLSDGQKIKLMSTTVQ